MSSIMQGEYQLSKLLKLLKKVFFIILSQVINTL